MPRYGKDGARDQDVLLSLESSRPSLPLWASDIEKLLDEESDERLVKLERAGVDRPRGIESARYVRRESWQYEQCIYYPDTSIHTVHRIRPPESAPMQC